MQIKLIKVHKVHRKYTEIHEKRRKKYIYKYIQIIQDSINYILKKTHYINYLKYMKYIQVHNSTYKYIKVHRI